MEVPLIFPVKISDKIDTLSWRQRWDLLSIDQVLQEYPIDVSNPEYPGNLYLALLTSIVSDVGGHPQVSRRSGTLVDAVEQDRGFH